MLPRDKGGVVDPKLKVYGTTNVRVVDISIIPLHVGAHTQCKFFMVGISLESDPGKLHAYFRHGVRNW